MITNCNKCHLLLSTEGKTNIQITNVTIKSFSATKLLAVTFGSKLRLDKHRKYWSKSRKLNALARLANYITDHEDIFL